MALIEPDAERWLIAHLEQRIGELMILIAALYRRIAKLEQNQHDR